MDFIKRTQIDGVPAVTYFATLIEEFEKKELDLARSQTEIGYMRQFNNASRQLLTAMIKGV